MQSPKKNSISKNFHSLIESLLTDFSSSPSLKMTPRKSENGCCMFIKKEINLMPIFYKIPIHILIQLFFIYSFLFSGFSRFSRLKKLEQKELITFWESIWNPGHTLLRLLRNLVCLYYFDHTRIK